MWFGVGVLFGVLCCSLFYYSFNFEVFRPFFLPIPCLLTSLWVKTKTGEEEENNSSKTKMESSVLVLYQAFFEKGHYFQ